MFMDIVRSYTIIEEVNKMIVSKSIDVNNTFFYSYWHDYKALALARISKKYTKTIARAHRWDIYFEANNFPYLPYKNFIVKNISKNISISDDGVKYFEKLLNRDLSNKVIVSKLGKINNRKPQQEKQDDQIIICSCSTIIPVKRINLIIDLLASLNISNLRWLHYGDGYLRKEIIEYADDKLSNISFEFKGIVPNNEILDFYSQNYVNLFINLSESEGIPVSIMEALSAGIPVLATDVGGTSEAVNDGNGFLIEKDFRINEVAKITENYLNSSPENQQEKRHNAYDYWQQNFEATKNYTEFANQLISL
jgi:glycosyltransferase involved in cell wall biosynthesis